MEDIFSITSILKGEDEGKKDYTAKIIRYIPKGNQLVIQQKKELNFIFNDHSFSQLCNTLNIPTRYMLRCPRNLVETNLNYWINKKQNKEYLIRTKNSIVRAILSKNYVIINNKDLFNFLIKILQSPSVQENFIHSFYLSWAECIIEFALDIEIDKLHTNIGLIFINSEVGTHAVEVYPSIMCAGGSYIPDIRYYQKHLYATKNTIFNELKLTVSNILKKGPEIINTFNESEDISIDISEIIEHLSLKYDVRKKDEDIITDKIGGSKNLKDVVIGLGKASEQIEDTERKFEIKRIAGKLLTRYTKSGIRRFVDIKI